MNNIGQLIDNNIKLDQELIKISKEASSPEARKAFEKYKMKLPTNSVLMILEI